MPSSSASSHGPTIALARARATAGRVLGRLAREPGAVRLATAGDLRRMAPRVEGVVLLATAHAPATLLDAFLELPFLTGARSPQDDLAFAHDEDGTPIALRVLPDDADRFAATALYLTARKDHFTALVRAADARGLLLDPRGLWRGAQRIPAPTEADLYEQLGLQAVPAELREGTALEAPPRALLRMEDVRGIAGLHSSLGHGRHTLAQMTGRAQREGYAWALVTDEGLDEAAARALHADAEAFRAGAEAPLGLLLGAVVKGPGALTSAPVAAVDLLVLRPAGSAAATARALSHPAVKVLAQPREQDGLTWAEDLEAWTMVLQACAEHAVAPAVSGAADAVPLPEGWDEAARARGLRPLPVADAHDLAALDDAACAVGRLRRGRWERPAVLASLDFEALRSWCRMDPR